MYCKNCGVHLDNDALFCPNCGNRVQKNEVHSTTQFEKSSKKTPHWIGIFACIVVVIVLLGSFSTNSAKSSGYSSTSVRSTSKSSYSVPQTTPSETVSTEYQNALTKGLQYANHLHLSKKAIYDQLTSSYGEGFTADAAQYAINHMTSVDWNYNALQKAKEYQSNMAMSKSAIYDQLTSSYGEQFTASEAQYAIDHLN